MSSAVEILLAEDNPGDARLTAEILKQGKLANRLHVVDHGAAAIAFLRREGEYANAPRPDLVLLDLNLPGKDGRKVLAEIKRDPDLRHIPVIVLTASGSEEDVLGSYDEHANCYVKKPMDVTKFAGVVKTIGDFWLTIVKLPRE